MHKSRTLNIGGHTLPISTEALTELNLAEHDLSQHPISFDFKYRRILFKCTCDHQTVGQAMVHLNARIGAVPFTAQSPYARSTTLAIAQAAHQHLGGTISIKNGYVFFEIQNPMTSPVTSASLMTAIVIAIARINPYLALLSEIIPPPPR
jgi:multisubunit Na+/H+ antiporter MnhC subunit